jgi:N-acetylglutamate synthase-like GNAT family acetyltransferase
MMNIAFREATNEDTDKIIDLVKSILLEFHLVFDSERSEKDLLDIEKNYINNSGTFIVVEDSQHNIIGTCALLRLDDNACKLRKMYVDKKFRGLKLGGRLIERILSKAADLNYKMAYLETVHSMKAAISLYGKYGFEIVGTQAPVSPRCDTVMMKNL